MEAIFAIIGGALLVWLMSRIRHHESPADEENTSEGDKASVNPLVQKVRKVFSNSGLTELPDFRVSGYIDTSGMQLGSEYVTVDFKQPVNIEAIHQLKSLCEEDPKHWSCINDVFHYNKWLDDNKSQSVSFSIKVGASRISVCHFMQ